MSVVLYSKKNCSACRTAKRILTDARIPFQELMLDEDFTKEFIKEKYPSATTYPVVVHDNFYIGGVNDLKEHIAKDIDPRKLLNE